MGRHRASERCDALWRARRYRSRACSALWEADAPLRIKRDCARTRQAVAYLAAYTLWFLFRQVLLDLARELNSCNSRLELFSRLVLENCGVSFFDRSQCSLAWFWHTKTKKTFGIGDASHVLWRLLSFCPHQQLLCVDFSIRIPCSSLFQLHKAASLCCQLELVTHQSWFSLG